MSCGCTTNPDIEIGSCGIPANRDDVVRLFNQVINSCCTGTINTIGVDPRVDAVEAFDEAFPDGVGSCGCDCIYIVHSVTNRIFINCTSNYTDEDSWCSVCPPSCLGFLTTSGLTPDDPAETVTSINEAFPDGVDTFCELLYIQREDGVLCYSTDNGITWQCPLSGNYTAAFHGVSSDIILDPSLSLHTGANKGQIINFWKNMGGVDDDSLVQAFDTYFKVTRTGRWRITISIQYFCPSAATGGTRDFGFSLRERNTNVVLEGIGCQCSTNEGAFQDSMTKTMFMLVDMVALEEYEFRVKFVSNLTPVSLGSITYKNISFDFLG